eukprot:12413216-Alexandrium_andersonii.AAC.1
MVQYLLKRAGDLKIGVVNSDLLKALEVADSTHITTLFGMDLQLPLSIALPPEMQEQDVCMRVVVERAVECGSRLSLFAEKG